MAEHDPAREEIERSWAKKEFALLHYRLQGLSNDSRARLQGDFTQTLVNDTLVVETAKGPLSFVLLGETAAGRAKSLLTKQPGTIQWIDSFEPGGVFWDIGANVGTFTLYAALRGDTRVVAFEPAAVNYFLLSANCEASKLDARVDCLLMGLGAERKLARLEVSQFAAAKSFSLTGRRDPFPGQQTVLVESMDRLVEEYGLPCPNYIKIDVPGVTEEIIAGATRTLSRADVRGLHIELRPDSKTGRRLVDVLAGCGLTASGEGAHGGSTDLTFTRR